MKWLGMPSVEGLVEKMLRDAVFSNPGPMRSVGMRLPSEHEARIIVMAEMFGVPKGTLMRDLMMSAVLEAEEKLMGELSGEDDQLDYRNRVEQYVLALEDQADHKPGEPELTARVASITKVEEGD